MCEAYNYSTVSQKLLNDKQYICSADYTFDKEVCREIARAH